MKISKKRLELLRHLEGIIGNSCYNANVQNWGPNGTFLGRGRRFRYPVTFTHEGEKKKGLQWFNILPATDQMSGRYAFGANELLIMRALDEVVAYLEENHSLTI